MITVLFQTESHFPVSREKVKDAAIKVLTGKLQSDAEVSIAIVGDRRMRELNRTYRHIDATTDVLSFPQNDPSQSMRPFVNPPDNVLYLGDIIVSYPQAVLEASSDNMMVDDKIVQLVLHGLDHLMGIHHPE
ncbi:rRNA maturation RNase YbeY [Candidatus Gottesmanbacteria bacterium]|nr:rRNA maturation RNase YbeY [Candidatus Gottesmanbacteria bacterium]